MSVVDGVETGNEKVAANEKANVSAVTAGVWLLAASKTHVKTIRNVKT